MGVSAVQEQNYITREEMEQYVNERLTRMQPDDVNAVASALAASLTHTFAILPSLDSLDDTAQLQPRPH